MARPARNGDHAPSGRTPHTGMWIDELSYPEIVLSCKVSIARNIAGHAFPAMLGEEDRRTLRDDVFNRIRERGLSGWTTIGVGEPDSAEALRGLVAQGVCPPSFVSVAGGGVAVRKRTSAREGSAVLSILVNDEDHLRFRGQAPGCDLAGLYGLVSRCEEDFDGTVAEYAFDPTFGYLTADPAHLGTGLHVGVTLHLAALRVAGDLEKVFHALDRLGVVVRSVADIDGQDMGGTLFEVFNAQTLGEDEEGIIDRADVIYQDLATQEDWARRRLLESGSPALQDFFGRALGVAQHARLLSEAEADELHHTLRMGLEMGVYKARRHAGEHLGHELSALRDAVAETKDGQGWEDVALRRADTVRDAYASVGYR